jgi:hypothetical protein
VDLHALEANLMTDSTNVGLLQSDNMSWVLEVLEGSKPCDDRVRNVAWKGNRTVQIGCHEVYVRCAREVLTANKIAARGGAAVIPHQMTQVTPAAFNIHETLK